MKSIFKNKPMIYLIFFCCLQLSAQDLNDATRDAAHQLTFPQNPEEFNTMYHLPPVNQDTTNACWSFATLSFFESEMKRLGMRPVRLAMMYPVYMAFLEKAAYFAETKGQSRFAAGDLFPTVIKIIQKYGIIPESAYRGQIGSKNSYNNTQMYNELKNYLYSVKNQSNWDVKQLINQVKKIMDNYMGAPPDSFIFEDKVYTPLTFRDKYVKLPWEEYIYIISFADAPFNSTIKFNVPDNWKNDSTYLNISLQRFYDTITDAIQNGYSVAIDGDFSEPGRIGEMDIAFIPDFDIPNQFISQHAREYRFKNGSTTDDHLMHIIGYKNVDGDDWFLVKDSWRDAFRGRYKGYFFYHESFVRLKVLAILVHKDVLKL